MVWNQNMDIKIFLKGKLKVILQSITREIIREQEGLVGYSAFKYVGLRTQLDIYDPYCMSGGGG